MAPKPKSPPGPFPSDTWVALFLLLIVVGIGAGALRLTRIARFAATPRPVNAQWWASTRKPATTPRPVDYKKLRIPPIKIPPLPPLQLPKPAPPPPELMSSLQSRPRPYKVLTAPEFPSSPALALPPAQPPAPAQPPLPAEFSDVAELPDSIGNLYLVGIYKNLSDTAVAQPRVEATLWDAQHRKLQVASGYATLMHLEPHEEAPVKILAAAAPRYHSISYHLLPRPQRFPHKRFAIELSDGALQPARFAGYEVRGVAHNRDSEAVRFVHVTALLLDKQQRIVGMADRYLEQRVLPPGDSYPFTVAVTQVKGTPASFRLFTDAMKAEP